MACRRHALTRFALSQSLSLSFVAANLVLVPRIPSTATFAPDAAVRRANGVAERAALVCLRPRVRARRADNNRLIYHGDCRGLLSSRLLGPYILRYPLARLLASRRFHLISTTAADATTCSAPAWLSWHRPSPAFAASQISN